MKTKKLIVYGIGAQAELAYAYFEKDSEYKVVAFTVEQSYLKKKEMFGLSVIPFENIERHIKPDEANMFVAIGPIKLSTVLENVCDKAREKGYALASFCSSVIKQSFEPSYGYNCFFDNGCRLHPFIKIGNGVTLGGTGIGHHVEIGDFSFLSAATLGGNIIIEDHVFIGMGVVIKEGVRIGRGSLIGMGCLITKDVAPYSVYGVAGTKARKGVDSRTIQLFKENKSSFKAP